MKINQIGNLKRYFNSCCVLYKNHYDTLGLTPKATQGEIKAAYYKLSMIYHPDKNKGNDVATEKFRDVTAAYEVLGNFKSRRLYDRGMTGGLRNEGKKGWQSDYADGVSSKGSRIQTTKGQFAGRAPIYDFDEWSRLHYGIALERKAQAKARFDEKRGPSSDAKTISENENIMLFLAASFIMFLFYFTVRSSDLDNPPEKPKNSK